MCAYGGGYSHPALLTMAPLLAALYRWRPASRLELESGASSSVMLAGTWRMQTWVPCQQNASTRAPEEQHPDAVEPHAVSVACL